jgi:hypothetical protein
MQSMGIYPVQAEEGRLTLIGTRVVHVTGGNLLAESVLKLRKPRIAGERLPALTRLARLAVHARSETARIAAIRELLVAHTANPRNFLQLTTTSFQKT